VNAVGKGDAAGKADAVTKGDSGGKADAAGKALAPPSPPTVVAPARPLRPKADERGLAMQPGPRAEEATRAGGVSPNRAVERREAPTIQRREVPAARPSTDTGNAADDPGAIIDWLLGEGSGKDR